MSQIPPPPIGGPPPPGYAAGPSSGALYGQPMESAPPTRSRRGCGGCLLGCLGGFAVMVVLAVLVVVVGAYLLRQAFPTGESFEQAATCTALRIVVNSAEGAIEQSDATPEERAQIQQGLREIRAEYERQCGALQ